ncbi:MAG TPA: hypothetical protein VFQ45_23695 [Longimicrobium sp.]|nr:hypothetical protein [Longimicrobium sp.]
MTSMNTHPEPSSPERASTAARFSPRRWVAGTWGGAVKAMALIIAGSTVVGIAAARGLLQSPLVPTLIVLAMFAALARYVYRFVRRGRVGRRAGRHARRLVREYGGGTYGAVALGTWLFLEARALAADWGTSTGVWDFLQDRSLTWLLGFSADSILNAVFASIWPSLALQRFGFWLAAGAVAATFLADAALRRLLGARRRRRLAAA